MSQCPHCHEPVAAKDEHCPHCGGAVAVPGAVDAGSLENSVLALMRQGEKIQAVKLYREQTGVGLAEAKAAVEAIERGVPWPAPASSARAVRDVHLEQQILNLMEAGRKIEAIKLHRQLTNSGLKEAKDAVEELAARRGIAPGKTGCLGAVAVLVACMTAAIVCICLSTA